MRTIVVDVETTGLHEAAVVLEVAAVDVDTSEVILDAAPFVVSQALGNAQPEALAINRYYERRVFDRMLAENASVDVFRHLAREVQGETWAGSNPHFDLRMLDGRFGIAFHPHHRMLDLAPYAAGHLGLDYLPGLAKVCELLGVTNEDPHSALGDARATAECIRLIRAGAK